MKKVLLYITTSLCLLAVLSLHTPTASAQAPTEGGQALEIAPPVITLSADPGQTLTAQISLRDISSGPLIVSGQVNDFVAAGEDGTPKILIDEEQATDNPYSLRNWINPLPRLLLQPQEIKNLPVTINVPADAAPGGYYGVVRFTATPPDLEGTGVSLSASLGSLILVTVKGDAKVGMEIEEFAIMKNDKIGSVFQSTPITFMQRLKNTGNIHLQPAGQVTVTDMFGKKIAAVNINLPPGNVLPQSIRKFTQPLDSSVIGNKKLFGRYTADLKVVYGANGQETTSSVTFWVIPYTLIGGIILALIIGFFGLRTAIKRYNNHIISKARK